MIMTETTREENHDGVGVVDKQSSATGNDSYSMQPPTEEQPLASTSVEVQMGGLKNSTDNVRNKEDGDSHRESAPERVEKKELSDGVPTEKASSPDSESVPCYLEQKDVLVSDHQGYRGIYSGRLLVTPSKSNSDNNNNSHANTDSQLLPDGQGSIQYQDHPDYQSYTGSWSRGAFHGQGCSRHNNGDSYSGVHQMGFRHGFGTLRWADGRTYSGSFVHNLRHGQGCYTWPDTGSTYSGAYEQGVRTGYGKFVDPANGVEYVGDWLDGTYHGYGQLITTAVNEGKRVYRGNFEHGWKQGRGMELNPDGSVRHDGFWKKNEPVLETKNQDAETKSSSNTLLVVQKEEVCDANGLKGIYRGILHVETRLPHGNGVLKYHHPTSKDAADCLDEYEGCFAMGVYSDKGRLRWKSGDCYDGDYVDGKRHGKGVYSWKDGRQYKGDFVTDMRHGQGTMIYGKNSSDVYVGSFKNSHREGYGRFVFADGSVYEGMWKQGRYHGEGKLVSCNKQTYEGTFLDGLAHGQGKETGPDGKVVYEGTWIHGDPEPEAKRKADLAQKRNDAEAASRREPPCEAVVDMEIQDAEGTFGQYTGLVLVENKKPHGVGRMVYLGGGRIHEGFWRNGLKAGHGRCFFVKQGDHHEGEYANNVR